MNYLYRTDSCESLSLEEACTTASPTEAQRNPLHNGQISWKDLQEEMRSSGLITNSAAIEYLKKRLSKHSKTCNTSNNSDNDSKGCIGHSHFAFLKEDNDNINLKYPDKAELLNWHQKLSYVKGLLHLDQMQFQINQEKGGHNESSRSIENFQAKLNESLCLDESALSISLPVVSKPTTQQMQVPIEMKDIKPKKPIQSRPRVARSA
eukprot:15367092-Ditylum_brightwellii.AAC.1